MAGVSYWPQGFGGNLAMSSMARLRFDDEVEATPYRPIFDRKHFSTYTMGDAMLEREIVGLFMAQLHEVSARLNQVLTPQEWIFMAHTLRGSAAAVGAFVLLDLAVNWEDARVQPERFDLMQQKLAFDLACLAFRSESSELSA